MYKVYGDVNSGNCYKIKLLMNLLDIEHEWIHVDILTGETRTPSFLEMNPNGKIPVITLPDGSHLFESNAILNYLAEGSVYLPVDPFHRAQVLQWQFFEQYSHEPYIATSRYIIKYLGQPAERQQDLENRRKGGTIALDVMERHLGKHVFFVDDNYSIADISLYAYTHVAHEGDFMLDSYPSIRAWLGRVASHPKHVTIN